MKNLAAFTAGALAYVTVPLPPFMRPVASDDGAARAAAPIRAVVRLLHLISYEHMGVVRVTCALGCSCEAREIDGHSVAYRGRNYRGRDFSAARNVSIYVEKKLHVAFEPRAARGGGAGASAEGEAPMRCVLALCVLERTSSGEHRFVLTRVTVSSPHAPAATGR